MRFSSHFLDKLFLGLEKSNALHHRFMKCYIKHQGNMLAISIQLTYKNEMCLAFYYPLIIQVSYMTNFQDKKSKQIKGCSVF